MEEEKEDVKEGRASEGGREGGLGDEGRSELLVMRSDSLSRREEESV